MQIYTSYFGVSHKVATAHPDYVQIAICGKMMFPWGGLRYPKLAPKIGFFKEWKKNHDNDFYIKHFNEEVLNQLSREEVLKELAALAGGEHKTIVLMCYEKSTDFCHRHLVSKWLCGDECNHELFVADVRKKLIVKEGTQSDGMTTIPCWFVEEEDSHKILATTTENKSIADRILKALSEND